MAYSSRGFFEISEPGLLYNLPHHLIQDGVFGRLFPVENVDALARLLIQEWNPGTLQSFGDALHQHVQANFSREQMCARTLVLWRSLKLQ